MASYGYDGLRTRRETSLAPEEQEAIPKTPISPNRSMTDLSSGDVKHTITNVKAVILLGGQKDGTRFRPLSLTCPKPLFPIAGVPMIYHLMEECAKVPGMSEIILNGVFHENEISAFARNAERTLGIPIRYFQEFKPLGTGGGIYFFRDMIMRGNPDCFFVLHADICADFPLTELLQFHAKHGEGNHMSVMSVKARPEQAGNYGCLVSEEGSAEVQHYVEKPSTFVSTDINAGVYVLSPAIFEDMKKVFVKNHEGREQTEEIWLEKDVIVGLAGADGPARVFLYRTKNFWSQVKTAGSVIYANRHYLASFRKTHPELLSSTKPGGPKIVGDVRINDSATVDPSATLGPNVSIGPGVKIGAGARIRDSILLEGVSVGDHSVVLNAIIDRRSHVGDWARVEGAPVQVNPNDPTTHEPTLPLFDNDGRLNSLVTILGEETTIASEGMVRNIICMPHKHLASTNYSNQIIL